MRIGGAGVCRTDLHILEGQWAGKSGVELPYTIGHENAGWVHAAGSAVPNVAEGDKVILHPLITCGLCRACRSGDDVHCENSAFPGIDTDGGYADYLRTSARSVVKIGEGGATAEGVRMLREAGDYHVVGYGENIDVPTIDIISAEINFIGNLVGSYNDLCELMALAARGAVTLHTVKYALDDFQSAVDDLAAGRVRGRAILTP